VARVVNERCPRCGATLNLAPNVELVTCHYCGQQSVIEWPNRKRIDDVPLDPIRLRIQVRPSAAPAALGCVLAAVLLAMASVSVGLVFVLRSRAPSRAPIVVGPTLPPDIPTIPTTTRASGSIVDIADLVKEARAIAVATEPHATLLGSVVAFQVKGGMLDTGQSNAASIMFSFRFQDSTMPPGKDMNEGSVTVHVANGELSSQKLNAFYREKALVDPKCSSHDAWATAVKTGVPENAIATFHLYDNSAFSPKSPTVWSIRVDGHDEYRREIDATNCALVKSWDARKKK
jgi:hypothetical protein